METGVFWGFGWLLLCVCTVHNLHVGQSGRGFSGVQDGRVCVVSVGRHGSEECRLACRCLDDRVEEPAWRSIEHAP
jgi:hypothetical protein